MEMSLSPCDPVGDLPFDLQRAARVAAAYARRHYRPPAYSADYWGQESLQIAALAVWRAAEHYTPQHGVSRELYAYLCARRALYKEYERLCQLYERETPFPTDPETGAEIEVEDRTACDAVASLLCWDALARALERLEATDLWLVEQVWMLERSQLAVARELGVSQPTLSRRLERIRKQLRAWLEETTTEA
jgi:RNA polymerase sigma factor (sigma-70 family)